jgi:glutamate-1-semialdehyde 2,1-aminomutase
MRKLEVDMSIMTPKSRYAFETRAAKCMPGGVPTSYHARQHAYPIYLQRSEGGRVWDLDGNEFSDFHLDFGALMVGHKNPHVVEAIKGVMSPEGPGLLLGAPHVLNMDVAELLGKRYQLPFWRFMNSGTEATRDAIQLARGFTGRDYIIKIEGGYHGMHESVNVSVHPTLEEAGDSLAPKSVPDGKGEPRAMADLTLTVPFNCDVDIVENCIRRVDGQVACVIMEPIMLNCGMILPRPGFLQMMRDVCTKYDMLLIFDEVKTGGTVAPGGATGFWGVLPDILALGKAHGGGVAIGALGMNEKIAQRVSDGTLNTVGTFSGNPLAMVAAAATLTQVLTDANYQDIDRLQKRLVDSLRLALREARLNAIVVNVGAKGYIQFFDSSLEMDDDAYETDPDRYRFGHKDYRAYKREESDEVHEALWYYLFLNGVRIPKGEEWTISPLHTDEDIDRFVYAFRVFARDWPKNKLREGQVLPLPT